ncbi:hypothetical protein [Fluviispira vulneris]|uniref:hypothetical protein n=1 Tax=Fluviispira vulneris TaxID=2763012 RepID=UPI0016452123|nr:hypothetical protein [Fluviispira vulneris]
MLSNNNTKNFIHDLDSICLHEEEGYTETLKVKEHRNKKSKKVIFSSKSSDKETNDHNVWFSTIDKYLNSVEYAFDKGNTTSKKVSSAFDKIPEPTSKKIVLRLTILFAIIAMIIFFSSCAPNRVYAQNLPIRPLVGNINGPQNNNEDLKIEKNNPVDIPRGQEQLFIKRENLSIKTREAGSSSGSIWTDSMQPKSLATEYQPSHVGETITVNIPDDLQFKDSPNPAQPPAGGAAPATPPASGQKYDQVKSMKFEIVGFEPGGDVYIRGTKNYISDTGESKNILIMAKLPQRSLNKFEVDAKEITQIAINENSNGQSSEYSAAGWDMTVSRKLSGYAPDMNTTIAALDGQKKELETQRNALKEQQKALKNDEERIKKDRSRLDAEMAQAKKLLDSATIIDAPDQQGAGDGKGKSKGAGSAGGNKPAAK